MLTLFSVFRTCSMYQKLVIISNFKVQEETPISAGQEEAGAGGDFPQLLDCQRETSPPKGTLLTTSA